MDEQLKQFREASREEQMQFQPQIFDLKRLDHAQLFENLLDNNPDIEKVDILDSQLEELVCIRNPRINGNPEKIQSKIVALTGGDIFRYGNWVYYPWLRKLVHLLNESEFIEVRTNRNMNKIRPDERDLLSTKKVGVVGLSVGKTIAVTMAMERSFGEIRLADFDSLELSNLNRLQTGVHSLGLPKTVIAAREILEIDPYLNVKCFHDGLNEKNLEAFFHEGGDLHLIVDECDSLDIKILLREKARNMKIPVVMDMNDRGTLDVERFDLEPKRELLHGLVGDLSVEKIKGLSNIEKIPYIMPMLGEKTISPKLKASMLEMGYSLSTWPQLSSSVMLGGAIAADTYRRIMLGEINESGRYWIDMEEVIPNTQPKGTFQPISCQIKVINENIELKNWVDFIENAPVIYQLRNWTCEKAGDELSISFQDQFESSKLNQNYLDLLNIGYLVGHFQHVFKADVKYQYGDKKVKLDVSNLDPTQDVPNYTDIESLESIIEQLDKENIGAVVFENEEKEAIVDLLAKSEKIKHLNSELSLTLFQNNSVIDQIFHADRNVYETLLEMGNDEDVIKLLNEWNGGNVFKSLYENEFKKDNALILFHFTTSNSEDIVNLGCKVYNLLKSNVAEGQVIFNNTLTLIEQCEDIEGNDEFAKAFVDLKEKTGIKENELVFIARCTTK